MGSVLIATPRAEDAGKVAAAIKRGGMLHDISICNTGAEVLRIAHDRDYGVVICTKALRDMQYTDLADMLPEYFGMIVMTSNASLEMTGDQMVRLGMPFKTSDLLGTVDMITQSFYRKLKKKKKAPPKRSEEAKRLIDAAKALLIERNAMTEPEAFRYIQKNSMDAGRSMEESAQMILTLFCD